MHHETVNSWHITEWHRKMAGRTKHTIRKKLHFTDECHQMMVLIRKRAHFTDDATLPFRDTGFLAEKGVSRKEKQLKVRKSARDTGSSAQMGVSRQNKKGQKNRKRKYNRGRERGKERKEKRDKR
jgi:hypothetical protein